MKKTLLLLLVGALLGSSAVFAASTLFSDVPSGEWYSEAVTNLANKGVIEGYEDGTFRPGNNITRAEMAVMLDRYDKYTIEKGKEFYVSEDFGIKFQKNMEMIEYYLENHNSDLVETETGIGFANYDQEIKFFYKDKEEDMETAILSLIESEGKDPNDCVVVPKHKSDDPWDKRYEIDLAEEITYTTEEQERIDYADANPDGPIVGDWVKMEIKKDRLIELCTEYADPAGLATSKSMGSYFEYNEYAKDKFVWFKESYDPSLYEYDTLVIF